MAAEAHRAASRQLPAAEQRPGPTGPAVRIPVGARSPDPLVIDCDRCTMRGSGCGDCVVTVLLGGPPYGIELDHAERHAIDVLAKAGLVPPLRMVEGSKSDHPEAR